MFPFESVGRCGSGGGGGVLCINLDRDAHLRTFSVY